MPVATKRNFTRGEYAPELYSRKDVDAWQAGAKTLQNVVMMKHGGVRKRMGTRLVYKVCEDNDMRLIPFSYSADESYALLFGQGTMRPIYKGGMILEGDADGFTILSISKAATANVEVTNHDYAVDDEVYFANVEGMTEINGRTAKILTVPDANNFTIDLDTSSYSTFTGSGGGVTNPGTPAPPPPPPVPPAPPPPPPPPSGGGGGEGTGPGGCDPADPLCSYP